MSNTINEELRKALTTANSGGSGDVLINEVIEREIHDLVISDSPILNRVTHKPWPTNAYTYRRRVSGPGAFFLADAADLDDAGKSEWSKETVAMKYIYSRVEVSGPMQYSVADHKDIMADEIDNGARDLSRKLEETLIYGTGAGQSFTGILPQIETNVLDLNKADENDPVERGPLYLSQIDEALDMPHRGPTTIAGVRALGRRINALLQAQQRFVDQVDVQGGFNVMSYRGLPIYRVDNEFNGTAAANTVVLFDHRKVNFVVQRSTFVEKLAKTKDTDDYLIGMYCTAAVIDEN